MKWIATSMVVGAALVAGGALAAEQPAEVTSSARAVRGRPALDASVAQGWRVVGRRESAGGIVYELVWGRD